MVAWLRGAGKLRAHRPVEDDIMAELLRAAADELACPSCGRIGLGVGPDDEEPWPEAVVCSICRKPIPAERVEALPEADMCAACQKLAESGAVPVELEYCPKCGAPMTLQLSRSAGLTRYVQVCTNVPPCRR
jgi:hypothetical protein